MSKILLNLNAQKLQLLALHTDDGTIVNNAVVKATLTDIDGAIVPEVNNVTLANINVNGDYSYTIPATLNQAPRDDYRCVITATVGGVLILTQNEPVTIEDRVDVGPASLIATTVNFRPLISADIPNNAANTTGTASNVTGIVAIVNGGTGNSTGTVANATNAVNVTGTVAIANGGTGQTTQQAAIDALTGTQSAGKVLRSDGIHATLAVIQVSDVPTLNQNTTGTASNVTGTVAIANGGTGAGTQQAAIDALTGTQTTGKVLRSDGTHATLSTIQAGDLPAATVFTDCSAISGNGGSTHTANGTVAFGFYVRQSVTFSNIVFRVNLADGGNSYDVGIYDSAGNLKAHIGAQSLPSTGTKDIAISGGGSVTLSPGKHYFAVTGNSAAAQLQVSALGFGTFFARGVVSGATTSGGALNSTITPPADTWDISSTSTYFVFALHN